jgi:hypothetical protein
MSGVDVARAMAWFGLSPRIIVLTSSVDRTLTLEPNILAFCAKPIRRGQLLHMMSTVLAASSTDQLLPIAARLALSEESAKLAHESNEQSPFHGEKIVAHRAFSPADSETTTASLAGVCVLLAEDNDVNRQVVGRLLEQAQCTVIEAVNGMEALQKLTDDVNLVLMDVHMPVLVRLVLLSLCVVSSPLFTRFASAAGRHRGDAFVAQATAIPACGDPDR